jgi:t-SNARE complex subunit (syntaxin)
MSRDSHFNNLERTLDNSMKIINDLTQENYELREFIKTIKNLIDVKEDVKTHDKSR